MSNYNLKLTETDSYYFIILDEEEAKERFLNNESVFLLYDDDTEGKILFEEEFDGHNDNVFGVSFGFKDAFIKEYEEGKQNRFRNNDKRNFDEWLNDKVNVFLE